MESENLGTQDEASTKDTEEAVKKRKRRKQKKQSEGNSDDAKRLKVCGPAYIQTLRGRLLGREVALICCGEAHEDTIDLTREGCIVEPRRGWIEAPWAHKGSPGFDFEDAVESKNGITLGAAKDWAQKEMVAREEEQGALIFLPQGQGPKCKGKALLFDEEAERSEEHPVPDSVQILEWTDLDDDAREFNRRRLEGEMVSEEEQDALIAKRKEQRLEEGIELFDDWLLRQFHAFGEGMHLVLEAPVAAAEVELHTEPGVRPPPPAPECFRQIELDSDTDSDDENDPDDGSGSFIDYLKRRIQAMVPLERTHGVDPRELGDADGDSEIDAFQALLKEPLPADPEETELEACGARLAVSKDGERQNSHRKWHGRPMPRPVPSWEAYFGAASELLYYSPQVKADFAPLLASCIGSAEKLHRFFEALYFGTVQEALSQVDFSCESKRPLTRLRSSAFTPTAGQKVQRRPGDQGLIPVKAAPLDMYLKSKGSDPPRLWVSDLAHRLRKADAGFIVDAAQKWWRGAVQHLLADPKGAEVDGDYFIAWLREVHRKIYDDIDRSDPEELLSMDWAPSEAHPNSKKHRHHLKPIGIPGVEDAFKELAKFDPSKRSSSKRERVLAKIMVDIYQLRLVDLAAVLRVADVIASAPQDKPLVVILYTGSDHTKCVVEFWRSQGFSPKGLAQKGYVGKDDWDDDEPRALTLPPYLHELNRLFPLPA